jgi:hypothetical protein
LIASGEKLSDDEFAHEFLKLHFLHWMEAMGWLGKTADVIHQLEALQSIIDVSCIQPRRE